MSLIEQGLQLADAMGRYAIFRSEAQMVRDLAERLSQAEKIIDAGIAAAELAWDECHHQIEVVGALELRALEGALKWAGEATEFRGKEIAR